VNWYAATRMTPYVDAGLFMDISDLWAEPEFEALSSTKGAMTLNGAQWGVPYTYYQWGVYYRKDIFAELGLSEPATWEEELANCQAILDSGRKCYTIGTAGGWFDYINSRTNGYEFHIQLANGEVEWTDDRVRQTFANWRQLIDMGAFIDDHQSYSWQEALPFMVDGEAAAYLMGNFSVAAFREGGLTDDQLDFYQFPTINADVAPAEDAPTDTFHIASLSGGGQCRPHTRLPRSTHPQTRARFFACVDPRAKGPPKWPISPARPHRPAAGTSATKSR